MLLEAVVDKGLHGRLLLNRGECRELAGGESVVDGGGLIGSDRVVFRVVRSSVECHLSGGQQVYKGEGEGSNGGWRTADGRMAESYLRGRCTTGGYSILHEINEAI